MFFPWPGLFEQTRLANTYVHYDDVQLPQGHSFVRRVQIKTAQGVQWLTVPLKKATRPRINEVIVDVSSDWKLAHLKTLHHAYANAPHYEQMINIVQRVYSIDSNRLSDINCFAIETICSCLGIAPTFLKSSDLGIGGTGSARLVEIVHHLHGTKYLTGHGARNYLDHDLFEARGIGVEYAKYSLTPYHQRNGDFTPYVSILDLIANQGDNAIQYLRPNTVPWRTFIYDS